MADRIDADGVELVVEPDGRTVVCAHFADGSWSYATDDGAGTTIARRGNADGTEFRQVLHCPDGSWTSYEERHGVVTDASGGDGGLPPSASRGSASPGPGR
jgi:hypothetical protein